MNEVVMFDSGAYETDADTAADVRSTRFPTDADPGWRPMTLAEATRAHPDAEFRPVTVEQSVADHVTVGDRSDADVLAGLLGSVSFDQRVDPVDDDEPDD